jgi:hypothetical protein
MPTRVFPGRKKTGFKGHLLAKKGTLPSHSDVFMTHPKVKVTLGDFLDTIN